MEEEGDEGGSFHVVHSVLRQPVEGLEEEEEGELTHELGAEVVSEHRERQTRLRHRVPSPFHQVLKWIPGIVNFAPLQLATSSLNTLVISIVFVPFLYVGPRTWR